MGRRVTLLRHAMPSADADADPATWKLTDAGRASASQLRSQIHPGSVLASSIETKSVETLCLAAGVTVDAVILDARFGEVVRSEPFDDEYRSRRLAWVSGQLDGRHEGWETPSLAAERFQAAIDDLEGDLVVATHGMVMTAWLTARNIVGPAARAGEYWSGLKFPDIQQFTLP